MIPFIFSIGLTANFILMHENAAADFLLPEASSGIVVDFIT